MFRASYNKGELDHAAPTDHVHMNYMFVAQPYPERLSNQLKLCFCNEIWSKHCL